MKYFKVYLAFFILAASSFCFAQDTIKSNNTKTDTLTGLHSKQNLESKKMVYSGESIYTFRLLLKTTELGKQTNNKELLRQVKVVKNNITLQNGFSIVAITTAITSFGLLYFPSLNTDKSSDQILLSFALAPLAIIFGLTAIINNSAKKRETRKLTLMYNNAMN